MTMIQYEKGNHITQQLKQKFEAVIRQGYISKWVKIGRTTLKVDPVIGAPGHYQAITQVNECRTIGRGVQTFTDTYKFKWTD